MYLILIPIQYTCIVTHTRQNVTTARWQLTSPLHHMLLLMHSFSLYVVAMMTATLMFRTPSSVES